MADAGVDYEIERMRIEVQISQLKHNRLAAVFRRKQMEADLRRLDAQIAGTDDAIREQEASMASLPVE